MYVVGITLIFIFMVLSCLHFYWVYKPPNNKVPVVPEKPNGNLAFIPGRAGTFFVAFCLMIISIIIATIIEPSLTKDKIHPYNIYAGYAISFVFFLRTIGDFCYIGLFKKVTNTNFARIDNRLYTPGCLLVGFLTFLISFLHH